jgi:hypothetical protein
MREDKYHLAINCDSISDSHDKCISYSFNNSYCNLFKGFRKRRIAIHNSYIQSTIRKGHLRFFKLYSHYFNIYDNADEYYILIPAVLAGHSELVNYIISTRELAPEVLTNTAVIASNCVITLKLMLDNERFHRLRLPIINLIIKSRHALNYQMMKELLRLGISNEHKLDFLRLCVLDYHVVKLLLKSGTDLRVRYTEFLTYFRNNSTPEILELLIRYDPTE